MARNLNFVLLKGEINNGCFTYFRNYRLTWSDILGVKLGGIGIGYAGGIGVIILSVGLGLKAGSIPWDVILIIASVISAIGAMQVAGGLDYLVQIAEKILRKNPKYINFLAPTVTYFLTIFAGTGHTAFSMIPVITEVAKGQNIKPSVPLSIGVVASQIAITASPVSAAVIFMAGDKALGGLGISYPILLAIWIPTTFLGCMVTALIMNLFWNLKLDSDPVYLDRLNKGLIEAPKMEGSYKELPKGAKTSVIIFLIGVIVVVFYASAISPQFALIENVKLPRDGAIMSIMLTIGALIVMFCKIDINKVPLQSTFRSGMTACICVLGVAWLGDTFVSNHTQEIKDFAGNLVKEYPALLSVALFFASMLLYSQAATAKALIPTVIVALGMSATNNGDAYILVASFAAVSALFVLPTYPTLLGAVQMDDTGTTRIGKYVFNHPFFLPGILAIAFSVAFGFILAPVLL
ncbi:anaerobic C4-dicarboxylate transporter, DcuA/DcuB family [Campylobacter sputorum subsp. sputorum]|nr:anaerobic C4-dicarboxylate transporter, DcuA/DcuB family [Campylobacter sputorum subsp. sputorum]